MSGGITVITGGARAGKSALAERLAAAYGPDVLYLATAEPRDDEMTARIEAHRAARPPTWRTLEASHDLVSTLERVTRPDAVLLDCLTVWTSNVILASVDPDRVSTRQAAAAETAMLTRLAALLDWQAGSSVPLIAVTNEVGLGVVPPTPIGRLYRDLLGKVNQRAASVAEEVYLVVAGLALPLKALGAVPVRSLPDDPMERAARSAVR